MKKFVSILLVTALFVSLLVGCGSKETDKKTGSTDKQVEDGTTSDNKETKKEPTKIEWLAYQTSAQPDKDSEIVKAVEERYNADFEFWFIDDKKWNETLNVRLASGKMPDVLLIKNGNISNYVEQGIIAELPIELLKEKAPAYVAAVEKYDPNGYMWNKSKLTNGKNYGWSMVNLDGKFHTVLEWRKDWLDNVGITKVPETLEEFEEALYAFRNNDPNKSGKKDTYGISIKALEAVFGAFGAPARTDKGDRIFMKDGKVDFTATQPEMKEALALMNKWYKDGVIDPEFLTGENTGGYWALSHSFMNDRIGVTGGINFYHYVEPGKIEGPKGGPCYKETKAINPSAEMVIGAPPKGPYGQGVIKGSVAGVLIGITTQAMQSPEKVDIILSMLNDLYADEAYSMMVSQGTEGVHYELDDKGEINYLHDRDPVKMRESGIQIFDFLNGSADLRGDILRTRYEYGEKFATFPSYAKPILPSVKVYDDSKETLKRIVEEAYIQMITGEKSLDYFDEFVDKFYKNGGTVSLEALNETYESLQ